MVNGTYFPLSTTIHCLQYHNISQYFSICQYIYIFSIIIIIHTHTIIHHGWQVFGHMFSTTPKFRYARRRSCHLGPDLRRALSGAAVAAATKGAMPMAAEWVVLLGKFHGNHPGSILEASWCIMVLNDGINVENHMESMVDNWIILPWFRDWFICSEISCWYMMDFFTDFL